MLVCLIRIKLHLFNVHSLKEKRSVLKSAIEKTRHKFKLSIAEVGEQDVWQSSALGIALVGNDKGLLEREMEKVLHFLENNAELEIVSVNHEIWGYE